MSTIRTRSYLRCLNCHHPMNGILSFKIREVCHDCGGFALDQDGNEIVPDTDIQFRKHILNG